MKVLAILHGYPPRHNAGAEWMLHEMLKYLTERGHSTKVLLKDCKEESFEGVLRLPWGTAKAEIKEADVIISHLKQSGRSLNICEYYKKPYVEIVHNSNRHSILNVKHKAKHEGGFIYLIYNSNFTRDEWRFPNPSIVVHPPIDEKRYKTKPGKKITLINLFQRKGGEFFAELAKLMPDYEFLGVEGGYGQQVKPELPNVEYMANTADAKKIYSKTRILLMPSLYESYGRTAIEACCSGIPVIAAPTPGLRESLGDAGIFCSLDSPLKWIDAIKRLDDPAEYKTQADKCLKRVKQVTAESKKELERLEKFLQDITDKKI